MGRLHVPPRPGRPARPARGSPLRASAVVPADRCQLRLSPTGRPWARSGRLRDMRGHDAQRGPGQRLVRVRRRWPPVRLRPRRPPRQVWRLAASHRATPGKPIRSWTPPSSTTVNSGAKSALEAAPQAMYPQVRSGVAVEAPSLPKLRARVRFSSPAPFETPGQRPGVCCLGHFGVTCAREVVRPELAQCQPVRRSRTRAKVVLVRFEIPLSGRAVAVLPRRARPEAASERGAAPQLWWYRVRRGLSVKGARGCPLLPRMAIQLSNSGRRPLFEGRRYDGGFCSPCAACRSASSSACPASTPDRMVRATRRSSATCGLVSE
ncbi:hypothetical protein SAMN04487981_1403 [Streptomyces sp. cf386]|nr:hypothetical protein SAMN04487981_1403 [Streptomyces sp. cf386]